MGPLQSNPSVSAHCVYVDAQLFVSKQLTGIARYTARLSLALAALAPVRFFHWDRELHAPSGLDWSQDQDLNGWSNRLWRGERTALGTPPPGSVGLYSGLRPVERRFPFEVSVLHDFTPLLLPKTHTAETHRLFQRFFGEAVLSSDLVLADSHSTKADASWLSPLDQGRIVVASPGPSQCVASHAFRGPVARSSHVGLVVSTLEPRKNARFLLDWFHRTDVLPADAELLWVGGKGWLFSRRELKSLERSPGGRRVRFLGYVPDAELCRLYRLAAWSVYPSLYEGFGFPVLDALRHGTPVLTSANSSLREFNGPGLHFFDPCDPATLDLAWRRLREAGPVEIPTQPLDRLYSWERVARLLLEHAGRRVAQSRPHIAVQGRAQPTSASQVRDDTKG